MKTLLHTMVSLSWFSFFLTAPASASYFGQCNVKVKVLKAKRTGIYPVGWNSWKTTFKVLKVVNHIGSNTILCKKFPNRTFSATIHESVPSIGSRNPTSRPVKHLKLSKNAVVTLHYSYMENFSVAGGRAVFRRWRLVQLPARK